MQKIVPFLRFNNQAEEAMNFYTSVFKGGKVTSIRRVGKAGPGKEGDVLTGTFEIEGQEFYALNGGPTFNFTPALSLFVNCDTQEEVDTLRDKLCEGGKPLQCGWLVDKFGISRQIVPKAMMQMMSDPDQAKVDRTMKAMMQMIKLDIAKLQEAYDG